MIGGYSVSLLGGAFTQVALFVQVFDLTDSSLAVGLLGAAEFVPIIVLALVGGALADAFDRRRLIFGAELASRVHLDRAAGQRAAPVAAAVGALRRAPRCSPRRQAVLRPPLDALFPRLVERDELKAATAINWSLASVPRSPGRRWRAWSSPRRAWPPPTRSTSARSCSR